MKKLILAAAALVMAVSCSNDSRFPGYEKTDSGAYFKLEKEGDGKQAIHDSDVIFIRHIMTTDKDSILYNYKTMSQPGQPYAMRLAPSVYKGDMFELIKRIKVGDSASFALRIDSMFKKYYHQPIPKFLDSAGYIVYHVRVDSLYSNAKVKEIERKQQEAQMVFLEKARTSEDSLLKKYLADNKINAQPTASGLYIVIRKKGTGPKIQKGDNVEVNYKGLLTNGRIFDASDKHDQAFVVPAGAGKVIPAWDEALLSLNVGSSALIVTPSKLAYGPQGSGPIPPYAPLVFELDVLGIKSDKK